MENLVEIFANTLDAILGIVFLTMILGKKKSMPNWLFVVLALIVPVANVVLQKVFPDCLYFTYHILWFCMHEWKNLREDHLCRNLEYPAYGMWTDLCVSLRVCRARDKWHGMGDGCDTAAALHHGFEAESDPVHASGHGDPEENEDEIRDAGHECCRVRDQYFDRYYLRYYAGLPVS